MKIYIQSARTTSSKKCDSACHVSENAQSAGLGGYSKKNILQGRNMTKNFTRGKTKSDLYYNEVKAY